MTGDKREGGRNNEGKEDRHGGNKWTLLISSRRGWQSQREKPKFSIIVSSMPRYFLTNATMKKERTD